MLKGVKNKYLNNNSLTTWQKMVSKDSVVSATAVCKSRRWRSLASQIYKSWACVYVCVRVCVYVCTCVFVCFCEMSFRNDNLKWYDD